MKKLRTISLLLYFFLIKISFSQSFITFKIVKSNNQEPIFDSYVINNDNLFKANSSGIIKVNTQIGENIFEIYVNDSLEKKINFFVKNDTFIIIQSYQENSIYHINNITYKSKRKIENENNTYYFSENLLNKISSPLSSSDPIHFVKILPGISHTQEMNSNINIRGGNSYNSTIYLDNIPISNLSHSFGLFSFFDANNLRHIELFNRQVSSEYGTRGGGYIQFYSKDPILNKNNGSIFINPFLVSASANLKLIKNKLGIYGHYRKSILSKQYNLTIPLFSDFQDILVKAKYLINEKSSVSFLYMDSYDKTYNDYGFGLNVNDSMKWKFKAFSANYFKNYKNGNEQNINFFYKKHSIARTSNNFDNSSLNNTFEEINLKYSLKNQSNKNLDYLIGFESQNIINNNSIDTFSFIEKNIFINSVFANLSYKIKMLKFYTQSRLNHFSNIKETFHEIRLGTEFILKNHLTFIEFNNYINYIHALSNNIFPIPEDFKFLPNNQFKPLKTRELLAGYHFKNEKIKWQSHIYLRNYYNSLDYINNNAEALNSKENITQVNHFSYGFENYLELKFKQKNSINLSYTYSRTFLESEYVNSGLRYPANYDRPNIFNALYQFKHKRMVFTTQANVMSGRPFTSPLFKLPGGGFAFSERNEMRLGLFRKLDIGFQYHFKSKLKQQLQVYFYNVLFARNQYAVIFTQTENDFNYKYRYLYTFRFMPSISYSIKF